MAATKTPEQDVNMRKWLIALMIVTAAVAVSYGSTSRWSSAQDGTGGTLPEITVTPEPTVDPVLVELQFLKAELDVIKQKLTENRSRLDVVVKQQTDLNANLSQWPTQEEWDTLVAAWAEALALGMETRDALDWLSVWIADGARTEIDLLNSAGFPATIEVCNKCVLGTSESGQ